MRERLRPPEDITPHEFFTCWVPSVVAQDENRRRKLGATAASLVFVLTDVEACEFTVEILEGRVRGLAGRPAAPDLEVWIDVETWRALNRGGLSAPEALLRRRVRLHGDFLLALKLHVILG